MQAKFDALIQDIPVIQNKRYLKILELQPAGKLTSSTFSFPSTLEHFELLKSLGSDRTFTRIETKADKSTKPWKMCGV